MQCYTSLTNAVPNCKSVNQWVSHNICRLCQNCRNLTVMLVGCMCSMQVCSWWVWTGLYIHRRRSGWNSEGDAWRAPKVGQCRMGWCMVRGVPSPADFRESEGASWAPLAGSGGTPTENGFWHILKATVTECSFLYLYDKNLRGTICISVPYFKFWGDLSPPPWSTPMYT